MQFSVARVQRLGLMRSGVVLGVITAALLQATGAGAAPAATALAAADVPVDPNLFGALRWRGIGP